MFLSRFKNFSLLLEELYNRQTQWTIPYTELREAVRLEVVEVLIPAYRSFIKRYSSIIESDRSKGKYTHPRSWRGCWENFLRVRSA